MAWKHAFGLTDPLRVPFEFRLTRDATIGQELPTVAKFFAASKEAAQKAVATKKRKASEAAAAAKEGGGGGDAGNVRGDRPGDCSGGEAPQLTPRSSFGYATNSSALPLSGSLPIGERSPRAPVRLSLVPIKLPKSTRHGPS